MPMFLVFSSGNCLPTFLSSWVISTDCSGIKENLGNGKWGYIVENRKETLYHAISRCFDEPGFLEELKKKSEAGSIQDTYEGRLKKIESIIEGVVN